MTDRQPKRITASFYRTSAGNDPVREWLLDLEVVDRRIVGADIATVEYGWPIGMPTCRPVGGQGVREVRSTIQDGKVEARVYFGIDGDTMVLLHAGLKRRQQADIVTAETRWSDYKRRKG